MTLNSMSLKAILLLILIIGWGSSAWAQTTSQLPLASGVYEILNISNESGTGTGRGYLVSFTGHSTGVGLADCTYGSYRTRHPLNPNDGSTTCSYWYLHNHGDGTYTLVSISTLGGNTVPRFLTVGSNGGKSSIAATPETRLVFTDTNTGNHNRNGKKAVNIANQSASNVYLSGGCGTNSTAGSIMATTTSGDGGCPWLFIPVEETALSEGQKAIRAKYLERFAYLPDGTKMVYLDTKGNPITSTSTLVKYIPTDGGYSVEFSSSDVTYNFHDVMYDPSAFCGTFDYSLQQVSFNKANSTLTFTLAINKWYKMKVANISAYVSTDYADANGMRLTSGQDDPDIYAGLWRSVDVGGASLNSDGKNVNLYNAKYFDTRILAMTSPASDGNSRGAMYTPGTVPAGAATVFEQRTRTGQANSYYFRITGTGVNTNTYINQRNPYFSNWTGGGYGGTGSQFIYEEVPNLGTAVTIKVKDAKGVEIPAGKIVYISQRVDIPTVKAQLGHNQVYNFGNVPYVRTLFSDSPTSHILNVEYDEEHAVLTFTIEKLTSVDWMVVIKGDNDYTVEYKSLIQAKDSEILTLPTTINPIDFTFNAPADKFVWGPVIDAKAKTITFEVSECIHSWEELTDGWYQLLLTSSTTAQNTANTLIKPEEGNINTNSNYLYLATGMYGINGGALKLTGVPSYAGREATFVHLSRNSNLVTLTNLHGQSFTTVCTITGGKLMPSGWNVTSTAHPMEGPFVSTPTGSNYYLAFLPLPVDISAYDQYRVVLQGPGASSDIRLNCSNSSLRSLSMVRSGDVMLFRAGSNVPMRGDFQVTQGDAYVSYVEAGEPLEDGVKPIYITLQANRSLWQVKLTGDALLPTDQVEYDGVFYSNGAMIPTDQGVVPAISAVRTNVTDRFVWGPIIDEKFKTISFDIRTVATTLTEGKWYQMQLFDKAGQVISNNNVQVVTSMVNGVNSLSSLRQASQYIYPITAGVTDWTVELTGATGADMESQTYVYISRVGASGVTLMMQNGKYVNANGEGKDNSSENLALIYQPTTKTFKWNTNALPWDNLRNGRVGIGNTGRAQVGNMEYFMTPAPVKAYKVNISAGAGTLVYMGGAEIVGSNRVEHGKFFFTKSDQNLEIDITKYALRGIEGTMTGITTSTSNGITTLNVQVTTPNYQKEIVHRQAYYYDQIETDAKAPKGGFIRPGEGMTTRQGTSGPISEQTMALFEIPVYLKPGTTVTSYMPTDKVERYQRWYNWDTDGPVDDRVLTSLSGWNVSAANTYINGHLTGTDYGGYKNTPSFSLPTGIDSYNVGLDLARYPNRGTIGSNGALVEPTLAMRIVYKVRDAKLIAKAIKESTKAGRFYEVHDIAFPNVHHGSLLDRTLSSLMPLDMDLNNYWIFNDAGETDADLLPLNADAMLRVELASFSAGAELRNVMMIPGTATDASGKINRTNFNAGHFVLFQYPESGEVPVGSTATINVYIRRAAGAKEYKLAQFNLTFIGSAEPVVVTELKNTFRHPDALRENFGAPVAELTFDNPTNNEFGSWYRYPLDYKGVRYAFGTQVSGGGQYFASRGEYGLNSENQSTGSTDGAKYTFYPVSNYLRNMRDENAALSITKVSNSYQLYIDAADQPGKVASIALEDALCAGSRLYCYGYIGCTSGGNSQNPTSVLINVMGTNKNTGKEELIYSYCPGVISLRGYAADGRVIYSTALGSSSVFTPHTSTDGNYWAAWQQIGFNFAISADIAARMSEYSIQIVNNAYNSGGGDTMLDDFEIFVKKPGAEVGNTTPLCSDQIRHIKVITEYNTLLEATGDDSNHDGMMNVGFCFLDKDVYDQALIDYADNINLPRTDAENTYNKAFGLALMGRRTLDKSEKDHAFHNFNILRDGASPAAKPDTTYYYDSIPKYSFKESMDDMVYRDSIRGERYIVFKESVAHGEASGLTQHKWEAGKSYYLLFSTATISAEHVDNHDLGCTVFNLDDNQCAVLFEFAVAPPVSIKGDAEEIISGDEINACDGQVATLSVNLNGRTETEDVVIKNLDYDWWHGFVHTAPLKDAGGNQVIEDGLPVYYNTTPATLQDYYHQWHGFYQQENAHLGKQVGDTIWLFEALLEMRRAYPHATSLEGVLPIHQKGDLQEFELTADMIECIRYFATPDESGSAALVLHHKEANLQLSREKADSLATMYFVVIPIAPGIYSVDEDAIYCPDPQELKINITHKSPVMMDGFSDVTYPEAMDNVPIRVGLSQLDQVRYSDMVQGSHYMRVPTRGIQLAYGTAFALIKSASQASLYLVGTDDPNYKRTAGGIQTGSGNSMIPSDEDHEEMFVEAGKVLALHITRVSGIFNDTHVDLAFHSSFRMREGYTYTFKIYFTEVDDDLSRDDACVGSFVFDLIIVPEYQMWTGAAGNNDWNNDLNWRRADVLELHADKAATGPLRGYMSNADNETAQGRVPMSFTNVIIPEKVSALAELYAPQPGMSGILTLQTEATQDIEYSLLVRADSLAGQPTGNYSCEKYHTNICRGLTLLPNAALYNAYLLDYKKAWVEYELRTDRWYLLGSPLQGTYAGEWYAPTATGKEDTPHFYPLTYDVHRHNRFAPAIYQRSWDHSVANLYRLDGDGLIPAENNPMNVGVRLDWSAVYNDVQVPYSVGGYSVKATPLDMVEAVDTVLIRMPKDDQSYDYYQRRDPLTGSRTQTIAHGAEHHRLKSDALYSQEQFVEYLSNDTESNLYYLVANPFTAPMDMEKFYQANSALIEPMYWTMTDSRQVTHLRVQSEWTSTDDGATVAPGLSFFVKAKAPAAVLPLKFSRAMQALPEAAPQPLPRLLIQTADGQQTALLMGDTAASALSLMDTNVAKQAVVYTIADGHACALQVIDDSVERVPLGLHAADENEVSVLAFVDEADEWHDWQVLDALDGILMPLSEPLEVSGSSFGRYFLVRAPKTDDSASEDGDDKCEVCHEVYLTVMGDQVSVVSTSLPIERVSVYHLSGQTDRVLEPAQMTREMLFSLRQGIYLIEVTTYPSSDDASTAIRTRKTFKVRVGY